jgi:Predicted integral membrane protein (DUF2275)/Putative zinc-finger
MNSHEEIRRRLAAYCGDDLEPAERRLVERHLADCPACRAELADLRTVRSLVRDTPEVDPPPWLTARIMARIREQQAHKRGWLQRLFFPLRIRLPLEVIALLLVCVSGYYLTRGVETDLQLARQQQLQEIPSQPTPPAAPPAAQSPAGGRTAQPPAVARPRSAIPPTTAPRPAPRQEGQSGTFEQQAPVAPAPAPYAPPPPEYRDRQGGKAESMKAAPTAETRNRAVEAAPEKKSKNSRSLESQLDQAVPAAVGRVAGAPSAPALPRTVIRLNMDDPAVAPALVREALRSSGGTVVEEPVRSGHWIRARIPVSRLAELLDRLEQSGRITERPTPSPGAQQLELTIQW